MERKRKREANLKERERERAMKKQSSGLQFKCIYQFRRREANN